MGLAIGSLHVRRSIFVNASAARVWKEFQTEERIRGWLDSGHTIHTLQPEVGGRVDMSIEIDGDRQHYGGSVLAVEPERELSFESQWNGARAWPVPTFWTIRLTSMYDGTLVELFHHGFERMGAAAADLLQDYEGGWDIHHLGDLRSIIESAD
jgi:uncharacterized protein YndB with AHSA1/START domain